jgi:uncharacterized BrkB/YihY/UPF0761 family membrane protein
MPSPTKNPASFWVVIVVILLLGAMASVSVYMPKLHQATDTEHDQHRQMIAIGAGVVALVMCITLAFFVEIKPVPYDSFEKNRKRDAFVVSAPTESTLLSPLQEGSPRSEYGSARSSPSGSKED